MCPARPPPARSRAAMAGGYSHDTHETVIRPGPHSCPFWQVRQSLKRVTGPGKVRLEYGLKKRQSKRTLRKPAQVRSALAALRREQAAGRLRLGEFYTASGLVFAGPAGRPRWPQAIRGEFRALCGAAGIGMWQLRELRHTFVSQMSAAGVDVEVTADTSATSTPTSRARSTGTSSATRSARPPPCSIRWTGRRHEPPFGSREWLPCGSARRAGQPDS